MKTKVLIVISFLVFMINCESPKIKTDNSNYDEKIIHTGDETYKLTVNEDSTWGYKINIAKKINNNWHSHLLYKKDADAYRGIDVIDWDNDGDKDLRVKFIAGATGEFESFLFLYDQKNKLFRNIEKYWWYCGSYETEKKILADENIFYSFIYWGCGGGAYESILFKVDNFKIIELGKVNINYCQAPFDITTYKCFVGEKCTSERIDSFSMDYVEKLSIVKTGEEDWGQFVEDYWQKNYSKFF